MIGKCTSGRKSVRHNDAWLGSVISVLVYCYLKKVSLTPFTAAEHLVLPHPCSPPTLFFFLFGGPINWRRDRFAYVVFAGFSRDISVLAGTDQARLWYFLGCSLPAEIVGRSWAASLPPCNLSSHTGEQCRLLKPGQKVAGPFPWDIKDL